MSDINNQLYNAKRQNENLKVSLRAMVNAIDVIWHEQGMKKNKNESIVGYERARKLLEK